MNREERAEALAFLNKLKELERNTTLHEMTIGNKTIVRCKQKDRLKDFKKRRNDVQD